MNVYIVFLLSVVFGNPYEFGITRVVDGDTVEFVADFMPYPMPDLLYLRIAGIDTPEKRPRAKCGKEDELAHEATAFTWLALKHANETLVELHRWDKYGGRVLGDVLIDGRRLSHLLLDNGHARPYHGEKKSLWC